MALTAKPISTISYNTEGFLKDKLDRMFKANIINDYRYIFHYGEDGDKDHFHVYIEPNKRVDTGKLREDFNEVQVTEDKPLGCMPFRSSKFDHWIMYVLHDPEYLKAHNSQNDGDGKIEYKLDDIKTPFAEQLQRDYKVALRLKQTDNQTILDNMNQGKPLTQIAYENDLSPMKILAMSNLARIDTGSMMINEAMKNRLLEQDQEIERLKSNMETMRLKELENKTGEDLHTKKKESVFDEG